MLAGLYRADRYFDEAGRWGYLVEGGATDRERAAYEHACAHRGGAGWTWTHVRRSLNWPAEVAPVDDWSANLLRDLDARASHEVEVAQLRASGRVWRWIKAKLRGA